ncbi:hypothetical protein [Stratiformator vulcanicus]|uniref:Uncharacterized protein n=1 Tax=Stratiformator vulcanicus TaxID=2527980 RepID=A0A517R1Q1_9PLAN|nr:hypothetical protein [Stratiformator vulcanicus]QDT37817.1 hypothetical protein Pan189_21990 [Stratiformator vulcanicus]
MSTFDEDRSPDESFSATPEAEPSAESFDSTLDAEQHSTGKQPGLFVIASGVVTALASLALLYYLEHIKGWTVIGYYWNFVIPIGAIGVGLCAGSGYGIGSWLTGARIGRTLLITVLVLQILSYFAAQYIEYLMVLEQIPEEFRHEHSFFTYFDSVTRAFAFQQEGGGPGQAFGAWGYGMRFLEAAGFALGGLIVPGILATNPYCTTCNRYMSTKSQYAVLPAGVEPRKIKKRDKEALAAYEAEQAAALAEGMKLAEKVGEAISADDPAGVAQILNEQQPQKSKNEKQLRRIHLNLQHCSVCAGGKFVAQLVEGHGKEQKVGAIAEWDLPEGFVTQIESTTT